MMSLSSIRFTLQITLILSMIFAFGLVSAQTNASEDAHAKQESMLVNAVRTYGRHMARDEAKALEQALEEQPDDLNARAKLLGYYFYQGVKQEGAAATVKARRRHITWLISNHPSSRLGGLSETTIDPAGSPFADNVGFQTASAMWRALAEDDNALRITQVNAFHFLHVHDKPSAEKIAKRLEDSVLLGEIYAMGVLRVSMLNQNGLIMAVGSSREDNQYAMHAVQALRATEDKLVIDVAVNYLLLRGSMVQVMCMRNCKPIEPQPVAFAGELLERCDECGSRGLYYKIRGMMSTSAEERQQLAQQELALLERGGTKRSQDATSEDNVGHIFTLREQAEVAFTAGEYGKAADYANELLQRVEGQQQKEKFGDEVHKGHTVLGRIALLRGDVRSASRHLLEAGSVSGSAVLSSFGPNMALAKGLLERGEREVVISYLKRCKHFWDRGQDRLDEWIGMIEKGGMPDFGANLSY